MSLISVSHSHSLGQTQGMWNKQTGDTMHLVSEDVILQLHYPAAALDYLRASASRNELEVIVEVDEGVVPALEISHRLYHLVTDFTVNVGQTVSAKQSHLKAY